MSKVKLWGFEKNRMLNTVPEGLYLLAMSLKSHGYDTTINMLRRAYVDDVKKQTARLTDEEFGKLHTHFPYLNTFLDDAANAAVLFHGIQTFEGDLNYILPLVSFLRKHSKVLIVAGGPFATLAPVECYLSSGADLLLKGECEQSIVQLASIVREHSINAANVTDHLAVLKKVPGIGIGLPQPQRLCQQKFEFPRTLTYVKDSLTFWHEMRKRNFPDRVNKPCTFLFSASRGCPRSCLFCSHAAGRIHRKYLLHEVLDKLHALRNGFQKLREEAFTSNICLMFGDDDFFLDRNYAMSILEFLTAQRFHETCDIIVTGGIPAFFRRREEPDTELIDAIAGARVKVLNLGTDAFCDEEIKQLKGGRYNFQMIECLVRECEDRSILNNHFWVLSGPATKLRHLISQVCNAYKLMITYHHFLLTYPVFHVIPYFGTSVRVACEHSGRMSGFHETTCLSWRKTYMADAGQTKDIKFYNQVDPSETVAARLLVTLEEKLPEFTHMGVPYWFDFEKAFHVVIDFLTEEMTTQKNSQHLEELAASLELVKMSFLDGQ